jgi:predicted ribosomally synthesized peptide with nif11-like leader
MSLDNVKLFYERLYTDTAFNATIQSIESKEACSSFVKAEGFEFTQQEFEDYTAELLEENSELRSVDERELELIAGGISRVLKSPRDLGMVYGSPSIPDNLA